MSVLTGIWSALLGTWIRIGTSLLPRTIHPMVLHFPIVLLYLAVLIEVVRYVGGRSREMFFQRAGFWVLTLSLFAIVAAAAAGVISEQFVRFTPQTAALLSAHQTDAVLTGVLALAAWLVRVFTKFPRDGRKSDRWSLFGTGRGRASVVSSLLVVGAMVMISITGSLGGTMVYHYGVGTPATLKSAPVTTGPNSSKP